ncbi:PilZ domain-containing protein [Desulfosarcina sp.]|uniref:PilZ domain-containing protein n=1 Tax=Desulfosarcina sp. TaxID=2027861 RepID=UPI0029BA4EB2|nr:PilZ domain-containing protein [Desulfosarcina sp.]MDX2455577.1 PilZ domain-containing protein [Desulfosarcina sp.]MDX2493064.1 PilZ domain-containing protein [Desulfosarcina sp.]
MAVIRERRQTARFHYDGEITIERPFTRSRKTNARLVDFSIQGLCILSQKAFTPGTDLMVRISMENYRHISSDADCQPPTMGLVTVKWCEDGTWQGRPCHKIGAMNLVPY